MILPILEEYSKRKKHIGAILIGLRTISHAHRVRNLELQKAKFTQRLFGDIILEETLVDRKALAENSG